MKLFKRKKKEKKKTEVEETEEVNSDEETHDEIPTHLENQTTVFDVIAPEGIKIDAEDYGVIKQSLGTNTFFRPFYIPRDGYPRMMQTNWLNTLTSAGEVDVMIDIHKESKAKAMRSLDMQMTMLRSNLAFQRTRGNIDQEKDLYAKIQDTNNLMDEIQFNENDSYMVSTMGVAFADSKKELDVLCEYIEDEMQANHFKIASTWNRVKSGLKSVLPLGAPNTLQDTYRNIDRRALCTFAPFFSGSGKFNGGVPIGKNKITGQIEFLNSFGSKEYRPPNYNIGVTGISGSGKSLLLKMKMARETALADTYAMNIDPEGEFVKITKRLGGINLNISPESNIIINPCAMSVTELPITDKDEELEAIEQYDKKEIVERDGMKYVRFVPVLEKINELLGFFDIIIRGKDFDSSGLNVFQRTMIEDAIREVFDKHGITSHPSSLYTDEVKKIDGQLVQSQVRKPEPELKQIYDVLVEHHGDDVKAEELIAAIRPFLRNGSKPLFDGQSNFGRGVETQLNESRVVNFNISQLEEGFLKPIAFHVILNYIWEHWIKNPEHAVKRKVLYVDEMWQFIDYEQTVNFLEKVARRARKRNAGMCWASQDFVRILENVKARGILQSTFSYFFLEQNKIDKKKIEENFNLTAGELDIILNNPGKGEGIFRVGDSSVWIQTDPSEKEMLFIESNEAVLQELLNNMKKTQGYAS
ncbi:MULTISPECIES: VirB4 family type IV secretion system protein [unclassified Bacillus (in: firmicutes)]|uniref:VirB4 family type IV secretion system protein n=1 Tax=unclassified Bacillus (in: firmicutes) TaxID=185979 RepID=UPI000BF6E5A2|nr:MULTISPECIES: hypothetical protein [unclassified Bacillus (in: firmicutes)]PEU18735.1 hypothetical protein CN525_10125 [Bacillus sp. AFS014408]PFW61299.1 hypothetical protein COL20_18055 [Bacillus sp. AFS075034]